MTLPHEPQPQEPHPENTHGPLDELDREVGTPDLIRLYLDDIGRAPLLDAATEVELAQRIEAGPYARHLPDHPGRRRAGQPPAARPGPPPPGPPPPAARGAAAQPGFLPAHPRPGGC